MSYCSGITMHFERYHRCMYDTIVVGTDGSEHAARALEHAVDLARACDATVHILTVVDPHSSPMRFGVVEVDEINRAAEELVDDIVDEAARNGIEIVGAVRRGRPAEAISHYAADVGADVLVVGRTGGGAVERRLLGSTTDRLIRQAKRPVIVVPRK